MEQRNMHKVARVDEFEESGDRVITEVKGRELAVFYLDEEYHAVLNFCVHQGGPLCDGQLVEGEFTADDPVIWDFDSERKMISCPWHNWRFDVETGENVKDTRYKVPTYDTEIIDGDIFVSF